MSICPSCLQKQPGDVTTCPADGTALVPEETYAAIDRDLAPGDRVGEYEVERKIGEGGFGAVYRAVHPVIGKAAAVKVLGRQFSANAAMVSRFIAEARAVNQIRHRNIIDIFAFGALADGRQYYIMELLEGTPFDAYLAQHRRLSLSQAMPILRGVARALDAAHAKGILHRDLKPENVYLVFDEDGRVEPKLLDFGLVKLMTEDGAVHRTKTGTPMGTPYYMSPEQCRGLEVDRRTDVYAFGAMIFQVLTGELPFTGSSTMDVLVKHMTAEPPRASERCREVPSEVDPILQRTMAKEPAERPGSLGEALDQLATAAGIGGVSLTSAKLPAPSGATLESVRDLETVATVIADAPPGHPSVPSGQTFLASESDIGPAPAAARSRRVLAFAAAGALALAAGGAALLSMHEPKKPAAIVAMTTDSAPPPPVSAPPEPPKSEDVQVRVEGAPAGAIVAADGKELGAAPGPFTLKNGVETKLTVTAKGYRAKDVAVMPSPDLVVSVALDKQPSKPVAPKGKGTIHSDLESFDPK